MTVSSISNISGPYTGNGATTEFAWAFKVIDPSTLKVYQTVAGVTTEVTTGITKNGVPGVSGTVVFDTAPASGVQITLARESDFLQRSDYAAEGRVPPSQVEDDLDRVVMSMQELRDAVERTPKLPITSEERGLLFPDPEAGAFLIARSDAAGWENGPSGGDIASAQANAAAAAASASDAAGSEAAAAASAASAAGVLAGALQASNNLSDVGDAPTARSNLGVNLSNLGVNVSAAEVNVGALDHDNAIINGAFEINQRGSAGYVAGLYGPDRWYNSGSGSGAGLLYTFAFASNTRFGKNVATRYAEQRNGADATASFYSKMLQVIEDVRTFNNETITVLGFARRSSGAGDAAASLAQYFGTGGSPSSTVSLTAQLIPLTTDWAPFAVNFSVPSVDAMTLGSANDHGLIVEFWNAAGSNYSVVNSLLGTGARYVQYWGIHTRRGEHPASAAWDYVKPNTFAELLRCERYFQQIRVTRRGWATPASPVVVNEGQERYRTPMRAIPSVSIPVTGSAANVSAISVNDVNANDFRHAVVSAGAGDVYVLNRYYNLDAEL